MCWYEQAHIGAQLSTTEITTQTYAEWARLLKRVAESEEVKRDLDYWAAVTPNNFEVCYLLMIYYVLQKIYHNKK